MSKAAASSSNNQTGIPNVELISASNDGGVGVGVGTAPVVVGVGPGIVGVNSAVWVGVGVACALMPDAANEPKPGNEPWKYV